MSVEHVEAQAGAYADSVTLMQVSATVRKAGGVEAAFVGMGTELNLGLMAGMGFDVPAGAGPGDLIVAVRAVGAPALDAALAVVSGALAPGQAHSAAQGSTAQGTGAGWRAPRTVGAAARVAGPGLALISVPGQHAFAEALDALTAGCDVMIFSDNVPAEQEIILKDFAAQRDLLVMGPDCGTAVVGGIGLGFSHTVRPGPVGLVAASGTGAQQVLCLLDAAGTGVTAALGVGGRDLSEEVGGRSARAALGALDADPGCELILVISKPPGPRAAAGLRAYAARLATPVQFAFTGAGGPDLTAATEGVLSALGMPIPQWPHWPAAGPGNAGSPGGAGSPGDASGPGNTGSPERAARPGAVRGLFAGGTLCDEAMAIASERLGVIRSNIPLRPEWHTGARAPAEGHTMIDFGDDELTAGRPHPMIDQSLRLESLAGALRDPAVAVVLLDVVLGHGAHHDPAAELAPVIEAGRAVLGTPAVVSLIGAETDPQGLAAQAHLLARAGADVFASNAQAARFACGLAGSTA